MRLVTEFTVGPTTEPGAGPIIESGAEPATEPGARSVTKPGAGPAGIEKSSVPIVICHNHEHQYT